MNNQDQDQEENIRAYITRLNMRKQLSYIKLGECKQLNTLKLQLKEKPNLLEELKRLIEEAQTDIILNKNYELVKYYLENDQTIEDTNIVNLIKNLKLYFYTLYSTTYLDNTSMRLEILWKISRSIDDIVYYYSPQSKHNSWTTLYMACYNDLKQLCPGFANLYTSERSKEDDIDKVVEFLYDKNNLIELPHVLPQCLLEKKMENIMSSINNDTREIKYANKKLEKLKKNN